MLWLIIAGFFAGVSGGMYALHFEIATAEARAAGTVIEDVGEGFQKIVDMLAELKIV